MAKLAAEKEATLRLKGENGIMKKKFSRLSKSVPYRYRYGACCTCIAPGGRNFFEFNGFFLESYTYGEKYGFCLVSIMSKRPVLQEFGGNADRIIYNRTFVRD